MRRLRDAGLLMTYAYGVWSGAALVILWRYW